MVRDKNADKRFEFNQKISDKEKEKDELYLEEQRVKSRVENFKEVMMLTFLQLREIDEDINRRSQIKGAYDETTQKQTYISNMIVQQQEGLQREYKKASIKLEDEREKLQKERDNLAWD